MKLQDAYELARGVVEQQLDDATVARGSDSVYNFAIETATNALKEAGVDAKLAGTVAQSVAMDYANP